MRTTICFLFILLVITGCCPPRHSIEFINSKKEIKVLSEDYFLKSLTITEYLPKDNYIEEIDSNKTEITFTKNIRLVNLYKLDQKFNIKGKKIERMLSKKYLQYKVYLTPKNDEKFDATFDEVYFVSEQIMNNKMEFETNGCK